MANVNRQQRIGCLHPRASLLLCKPFVTGRLRPRAKPASQLTRAMVYQGHRNIPGNVMRWRKSSLSDLPSWGCITGYSWKDNLISCLMPILKGQSRSRELPAGLCKLGANHLRPWGLCAMRQFPSSTLPPAAVGLSSNKCWAGF